MWEGLYVGGAVCGRGWGWEGCVGGEVYRKRLIFIFALAALVCSGCRKEADYHPYIGETGDLAYDSYASQFDYLWKCMSTGYVFWDVDETDWDAVYVEYMPQFQALDLKHEAGRDVTLANH